jgi:hypothetical protein
MQPSEGVSRVEVVDVDVGEVGCAYDNRDVPEDEDGVEADHGVIAVN